MIKNRAINIQIKTLTTVRGMLRTQGYILK